MISTEPRIDNFNWTESFYSIKDQYSDWRQTSLKIVLYIPAAILGLIELFVNMGLCILHATCPCLYKKEIVQVQPPSDNNNLENQDLSPPPRVPPTAEELAEYRQQDLEFARIDLAYMVINSTLGGFLELASTPTEDTDGLDLSPYQNLKEQLQETEMLSWSPAKLREYEVDPNNRPLNQFKGLDTIETRLQETNPDLLEEIQMDAKASEALLGTDGNRAYSYLEENPGILEELMLHVLGRSGESPL